jgi:hypothetical protein
MGEDIAAFNIFSRPDFVLSIVIHYYIPPQKFPFLNFAPSLNPFIFTHTNKKTVAK